MRIVELLLTSPLNAFYMDDLSGHFLPYFRFVGSFPIFGEIHTYFPDGSFSFNRDVQKEGWCRVSKVDEITYREEFLFLDIHGDMGDISVLLQYQPDTEEVLVAQNISGWISLIFFFKNIYCQ